MPYHAGDLSNSSFAAGPLYVCASIGGGCGCFYLGKQAATALWTHPVATKVSQMLGTVKNKPTLLVSLITFVGVTMLRAALGAHGFVRYVKVSSNMTTRRILNDADLDIVGTRTTHILSDHCT